MSRLLRRLRGLTGPVSFLFLAAGVLACSSERLSSTAPPLPDNLDAFDSAIAERIRQSVAKVESAPDDAEAWRDLGMLYQAHDQLEIAARSYRHSLTLEPAAPRVHFYLALADERLGNVEAAISGMRRVTELDASYEAARWRLGLWLLESGDADGALAAVGTSRPEASKDPSMHYVLARARLDTGAAEGAAQGLEAWLATRPDDRYARFLLGTAYRRLGRAEDAQAELALAQSAAPQWTDDWSEELLSMRAGFAAELAQATALLETKPGQAVASFERLRLDQPDNATILINLGIGYRKLGRAEESVSALRQAIELEPNRGLAHFHLALSLADRARLSIKASDGSKQMEQALVHAQRAVELQPTSAKNHAMYGELLARAGAPEAAVDSYRRAVRDPQDPAWLYRLGGLLCQLNRWSEAVPVLEDFVDGVGANLEGLLLLGVAQANAGDLAGGRATLEKAAALSPGEARVEQALAQLAARTGGAGS